jgi:hypothetical protein
MLRKRIHSPIAAFLLLFMLVVRCVAQDSTTVTKDPPAAAQDPPAIAQNPPAAAQNPPCAPPCAPPATAQPATVPYLDIYGFVMTDFGYDLRKLKPEEVAEVLAVMSTAGLYDDSGKWLFRTGLPGKSGVGGGLIAVSPGKFGIAVISPPLDEPGNSVRGQKAITDISNTLRGNPYLINPSAAPKTN